MKRSNDSIQCYFLPFVGVHVAKTSSGSSSVFGAISVTLTAIGFATESLGFRSAGVGLLVGGIVTGFPIGFDGSVFGWSWDEALGCIQTLSSFGFEALSAVFGGFGVALLDPVFAEDTSRRVRVPKMIFLVTFGCIVWEWLSDIHDEVVILRMHNEVQNEGLNIGLGNKTDMTVTGI